MSKPRALRLTAMTLFLSVSVLVPSQLIADTYTFQQGTDGYDRAQDTSIRWIYGTNFDDTAEIDSDHPGDPGGYETWSTNGGRTSVLEVGQFFQSNLGGGESYFSLEAGPAYRYSRMYIRFRDVFGTGPNQVPSDAEISRATLKLYNTYDQGGRVAAGGAANADIVVGPGNVELQNLRAEPKLNSGNIAIYPSLIPIVYGFQDGLATKGKITARARRFFKEGWAQSYGGFSDIGACFQTLAPNDPLQQAFLWGPADFNSPCIAEGENKYDSSHPGSIEIVQDADEEFKEFDVSGLMNFITGNGVFITALSPEGELPTWISITPTPIVPASLVIFMTGTTT